MPQLHTYSDLYYFPGNAYSPLDYLDIDTSSIHITTKLNHPKKRRRSRSSRRNENHYAASAFLPLYGLTPENGEYRLMVVLLRHTEDDSRIVKLRRNLYPAEIRGDHTSPLWGFNITLLPSHQSPTPIISSVSGRHDSVSPVTPIMDTPSLLPLPRLASLTFNYLPSTPGRGTDFLPGLKSRVYDDIDKVLSDAEVGGKVRKLRRLIEARVWTMLRHLHEGKGND